MLVTINKHESSHSMHGNRHKPTMIPPQRGLIRNPAHSCPLLEIHTTYYNVLKSTKQALTGNCSPPFQPSTTHYTDTIHEAETEPPIPVRNINELINPTNHA